MSQVMLQKIYSNIMEDYLNINEKFKEENIVPLEKAYPTHSRKNTLVNYYRWMLHLLFRLEKKCRICIFL